MRGSSHLLLPCCCCSLPRPIAHELFALLLLLLPPPFHCPQALPPAAAATPSRIPLFANSGPCCCSPPHLIVRDCPPCLLRVEGIRHAILIGDEHQVLPTVKSKVSDAARFGRSLFERLDLIGHEKHLLDTQYSMHPEISNFPNLMFYDGLLVYSPKVRHSTYERHYLEGPMYGHYSFINFIDGIEEKDEVSSSWKNMAEVAVVIKIIRSLFKSWTSKEENISIGIMSPYTAQINAIQMRIANEYKEFNGFDLEVKSIDEFRGSKMDIIIISTIRCNDKGKFELLSNLNRTNVALTRARHCLWIPGHASTLLSSKSVCREVIFDIKKRGLVFNVVEDKGLEKLILQVKNELKQLEMITPDSVLLSKALWKVYAARSCFGC